jgi:hypothetical protein
MARFIALLLIGPWLIVLGWLYWLYARKRAARGVSARFDAGVLLASAVATVVCTAIGYEAALGHGGPIWKQAAAALGAYAGFNLVILFGLLRHWLANGSQRGEASRETADIKEPS